MIFNSVPSDERGSSLPHNCSAGAAEARQPRANFLLGRLTRTYDRFIDKHADDLEVIGIAGCGAVPSALVFALAVEHGPFWAITATACSVGFYAAAMTSVISFTDKITALKARIAEINDSALWRLCESRREQCDKLMSEISHLEQDVAHWKAISFTARGGVKEAAADSTSERNGSAAVLEFHPKGA